MFLVSYSNAEGGYQGSPTPTVKPYPTIKPSPTTKPSPTKKPFPTGLPFPTKIPTPTKIPWLTPTDKPRVTPTDTPEVTPTDVPEGTPTLTPSSTVTPTPEDGGGGNGDGGAGGETGGLIPQVLSSTTILADTGDDDSYFGSYSDGYQGTPISIRVPRLGEYVSLTGSSVFGNNWEVSNSFGNYLIGSSKLGEVGNTILYGHNREDIFDFLSEVIEGDVIYLENDSREVYSYEITSVSIVDPDDVSVLYNSSDSKITIYTCSGDFDSERLVVQASPLGI